MKTRPLLLIAFAVYMLSACATTSVIQPAAPPSDGLAHVHFIRKSYPPYVYEARLIINGKPLATISNNNLVAVNVPVGSNRIAVEAGNSPRLEFDMPIEKAERIYVLLSGEVSKAGAKFSGYGEITIGLSTQVWAKQISRAEAESVATSIGKNLE